ncbi:forkhead box protein O3B isoform X2 [Brachyhypopomus gauderio]
MINPEGGRGGKAPRRRAVSMDNGNKYAKSARGRAAKKKAALQDGSLENVSAGAPPKWPGSPTSRSSDELDACWTDFRSRTNSNASTISGRLSPILANPELDEVADEEPGPPLSPMLYSSPSSLSPPSSTSSNSKQCPAELPHLGTMNLNEGLTDNLMDSLLDNITLAPSTQAGQGGPAFNFGSTTSSPNPSSSSPGGGNSSGGFSSSIFGPSAGSLRQTPMQTIQENKQTSFSSVAHFRNATLQELLNSDSLGSHSHSDVMMTQSDPLISQTSAAVTMMSSFSSGLKGQNGLLQNNRHHPGTNAQGLLHSLSRNGHPSLTNDANNIASAKHRVQQQTSLLLTDLYSGMNGGSAMGIGFHSGSDRFPSDLDLDMFSGSLDCDVDSIIRSDLMDDDGLDFNFDALVQNGVNLNPPGNFSGTKQSSQSWVPG